MSTVSPTATDGASMRVETEQPITVIPQQQGRTHVDFVAALQMIVPGIVAVVVTVSYLVQVIQTGNTDSELGSSLPIIIAAYFITHTGTVKRNGV